eukprot:8686019-Alexandrium_andersonii.AAC.1
MNRAADSGNCLGTAILQQCDTQTQHRDDQPHRRPLANENMDVCRTLRQHLPNQLGGTAEDGGGRKC